MSEPWEHRTNRLVAGLNNVGSYQVSGHPFLKRGTLTGETGISFATVTRSILIKNTHASLSIKIHFASAAKSASDTGGTNLGTLYNYWTLENQGDSIEMEVKCTKIFLTPSSSGATYEMFTELTHIPATEMYDLDVQKREGVSVQ